MAVDFDQVDRRRVQPSGLSARNGEDVTIRGAEPKPGDESEQRVDQAGPEAQPVCLRHCVVRLDYQSGPGKARFGREATERASLCCRFSLNLCKLTRVLCATSRSCACSRSAERKVTQIGELAELTRGVGFSSEVGQHEAGS